MQQHPQSFSFKQQIFNVWAHTYDWLFPSVVYQAIHQRLLSYIHLSDQARVLDIGCGTGKLLDRLACHYPDLQGTGIDFSAAMIREAERHNSCPSRLTYQHGNAESLPFANEQFDAVFSTISFLHYVHPERVLSEVQRVLRPHGAFYLVDLTVRWATAPQVFGMPPAHIRLYSPEVREALGQQAGLTTVAHHYLLGSVLLTIFQPRNSEPQIASQ